MASQGFVYIPGLGVFLLSGGGGSIAVAYDVLSDLTGAEISVTGTTTATVSRMHACRGTTSNYTITLPAAASCTGKLIGFRMDELTMLSKLVTLDANGSEFIDSQFTRVMWAGEAALLLSDGGQWFKIAGRAKPMIAIMSLRTDQGSVVTGVETKILLDTTETDNTLMCCDPTTNHRINVVRDSTYTLIGSPIWSIAADSPRLLSEIFKNGASFLQNEYFGKGSTFPSPLCAATVSLTTGDYLELRGYQNTGGNQTIKGNPSGATTQISMQEIPTW